MERFSADLHYPEIAVSSPNISFAKKLLIPFASKDSELTAVLDYSYHATIFSKTDPPLSKIMSGIGRVEMTHLNILSKLIYLLGYDPKYRIVQNNLPAFWNAESVNYKKDAISILQTTIKDEEYAYKYYLFLAQQTKDLKVKQILLRLSADEKLHTQILTEELKKR